MIRFRMLTATALLALVPGIAWSQTGDMIYGFKGTPLRGTITATTPDEITVNAGGNNRTISVGDIKYITLQDEPSALSSARRAILDRNYNGALTDLNKIDLSGANITDLIKQDVEFYKALSLAKLAMGEGGDKKAAGGAIVGFTKTYTGSYHFYEATEVAGDLAMSSGSYAFASTQYGVIANKATKWPEMQMRARLADGRCLFAQKKYDEAKARFDEVLSTDNSAPNLASYKIMAEVGKASCLAETGKPDEAIKALELILEKNDPADAPLFSRTYVALGNALVKANKPKDAIMAFLAVELLYYGEADAYAESLYNLSKLWDKENRADRALAARNMLKERFGGTPWASQN